MSNNKKQMHCFKFVRHSFPSLGFKYIIQHLVISISFHSFSLQPLATLFTNIKPTFNTFLATDNEKKITCWKKYHDRYHDEWEQCLANPLLNELSKMYPSKWIPELIPHDGSYHYLQVLEIHQKSALGIFRVVPPIIS